LRRGGRTGATAIARREHCGHVARRASARADVEQRSGDDPDHTMQESGAADFEANEFTVVRDVDGVHGAHGPAAIGQDAAKRHEVVLADQKRCARAHRIDIERAVFVVREPA